ncbi:sigma-54-dependent Fis family transcriptional regulator [Desulfovibrio fairfieldensis]|uniref:ArsR family transcriptional regulator n=1 Tax=Desulfovibrio fairfieldensis TaxID=44742 RepID=A0A0X8JLV1_9BACT|nr:sigma 54-interacting transcriptional regulator [Desulfovibrio fairfieldensis]AMD90987.1 ArsR family transcriptional regulator [Desulfovibrio fairfieldensis]
MLSQMSAIPNLEELIRRSHARSARYGLDPHLDGAPEAGGLSAAGLRKRINGQREFFDLARAQIDTLYGLLKGTGFCMALADSEGYVLYVVGDAELVEHFKRRRCLPGYRWLERDVGTCAIGLALEEKVPVFLPGDAMFSMDARRLSNAGAPVFAPDGGVVLGAISLSGESAMMHVHTLGLVRQAAETVTSQLRERERMRDLATTNQYLRALIESDSRGIVTVDSHGRIVQTNRSARRLFSLPVSPAGRDFEDFTGGRSGVLEHLATGKSFKAREILARHSGMTHFASFDPICMSNGEVVGGLLTVQEKKEVMGMAVEVTGSHAHFTFDSILGSSACLGQALRHARIAAASTAPVLLCGETGTGKELFAQAIHNGGERRNRPFVAINCGAIPKELLESELFGYEEGAFTGARKGGRPGKFELADSGTLFLDEIGDMPFDMQVKLLRVLQTGEIQRVGGLRTVPVDLRVISATNKDLRQAIEQQKFRADLYYRISTLNILVPPLRERPEDILPLAEYFIQRHRLRLNKPTAVLPPDTAAMLTAHAWPGNVRQLESAVERAMHLAEGGDLLAEHFGIAGLERPRQAAPSEPSGGSGQGTLEDLEQRAVAEALARHNGNIRAASRALGVSRPTLYRKLKKMAGRD